MYMYKQDLALNNVRWLMCNKTKPNQTIISAMSKEEVRLGSLTLVSQPKEEKENSEFKAIKIRLKMTMCHILYEAEGLGKYNLINSCSGHFGWCKG